MSAMRTPIGRLSGTMAALTAADMGMVAAQAIAERRIDLIDRLL